MIKYAADGATLIGPDGPVSLFGGDAYNKLLLIFGAQSQANTDNLQKLSTYNVVLANQQQLVKTSGVVQIAPIKPLMRVVSDTGVVSYQAFVPPLADLVQPAPVTDNTIHGLSNSGAVIPPDPQVVMFNMILAMFRKMFPDAG